MTIAKVEVEIDLEVVANLISNADIQLHPLGNIIADCHRLLHTPWDVTIKHVRRNYNYCADKLAKMGHSCTDLAVILDSPPEDVAAMMIEDLAAARSLEVAPD